MELVLSTIDLYYGKDNTSEKARHCTTQAVHHADAKSHPEVFEAVLILQ
jgi:hypothetical protein